MNIMSIKKFVSVLFALVLASGLLAACASPATPAAPAVVTQMVAGTPMVVTATPAPTQSPYNDNAPITVWIDQPRQPAIDAFIKANPQDASLIKAVVVDREQFPSKVLLFNNTNQGWPDVVFAEPRLVARVADAAHNFPLDLTSWVPADTINNYSAMSNCTFGGKIYCLRNDLAQFVTYYNAPLMTQFGYTVPTTWEDFQALSDKLAKDHPGYYLGTFGDGWTFLSFFEASNCPTHQLTDPTTLKIDVTDPNCVRAASLVDHMIANKTLYNTDYFNTQFDALITNNKVLMFEGPAWMWGSFGGTKGGWWTTATHQLGVAAPFKWAADPAPVVAAMGGAAWTVSRHTQNPKLAVALVTFVTEDKTLWTGSENFPSYKPIQPLWQQAVSGNPLFANDPYPIFAAAADNISPLDNWPRFDLISPLTQVVQDTYQKKLTVSANLSEVTTLFTPLAQDQGYTVVNK
jgi:ABC-type glycerol-3-phosphate transport system substrate-binding protein